MNTRLLFCATVAACFVLTTVAATAAAGPASASEGRQALRDSGPGWLTRARDLGATPSAAPVHFGVLRFRRVSDLVVWDAEQIKAAPKPAHDISPAHTPQARAKARRTKGEENRTL